MQTNTVAIYIIEQMDAQINERKRIKFNKKFMIAKKNHHLYHL